MNKIIIYTDGSSRGNPGRGGWGAIIMYGNNVLEIGGREGHTTNNRMELKGAIEALKKVGQINTENNQKRNEKDTEILIKTDSQYVVKGITLWISNWIKRNWRTADKTPVLNKDLWEELLKVSKGKNIKWKTVAGHMGISGNERCDEIATSFADNAPVKLYNNPVAF